MKIGKNFILFNNDEMPEYGTVCKKEFENKLNVENVNKIYFKNKKDKESVKLL